MTIEELQKLVTTLQADVVEKNNKIFELQTTNGTLMLENGTLKNDNLSNKQNVDRLTMEKTNLENTIANKTTKPVKDGTSEYGDMDDEDENEGFEEVHKPIFNNEFIGEF